MRTPIPTPRPQTDPMPWEDLLADVTPAPPPLPDEVRAEERPADAAPLPRRRLLYLAYLHIGLATIVSVLALVAPRETMALLRAPIEVVGGVVSSFSLLLSQLLGGS